MPICYRCEYQSGRDGVVVLRAEKAACGAGAAMKLEETTMTRDELEADLRTLPDVRDVSVVDEGTLIATEGAQRGFCETRRARFCQ